MNAGREAGASIEHPHGQLLGMSFVPRELVEEQAGAITGGDAAENAAALTALLAGARNPYRDTVLFNAAAALIVAGVVPSLRDGVAAAAHAIDSGRGEEVLANLVTASKEFSA